MTMAWRDLFIYSFIYSPPPPPPVPVKSHGARSQIAWVGRKDTPFWITRSHCQTHHFQSTPMTHFPPSLFSIDHLALSSINLQNALFKLLINTLIDLQKCHHTPRQELLMVVSPQRCGSLQAWSDECQNECVHYSLPGRANGLQVWGVQVNWKGVDEGR